MAQLSESFQLRKDCLGWRRWGEKPGWCRLNNRVKREQGSAANRHWSRARRRQRGDPEMITLLSQAHLWAPAWCCTVGTYLVCAVPGTGEGPSPSTRSPRGCIPRCLLQNGENAHVPSNGPGHWTDRAWSHQWERVTMRRGEQDGDVALTSWSGKGCWCR